MLRKALLFTCILLLACEARRVDDAGSILQVEESFGPGCGDACVVVVLAAAAEGPKWPLERANIFAETARLTAYNSAFVSGAIISRPAETRGAYPDDAWAIRFSCPLQFINEEGAPREVQQSPAAHIVIRATSIWRAVELRTAVDLERLNEVCALQPQ